MKKTHLPAEITSEGRPAAGPTARDFNPWPDSDDTAVEVELLGVARLLARRESVRLPLAAPVPLVEFLRALAAEAPPLVGSVLSPDGALLGGHVLSRNRTDLLSDPSEPIHPGDRLTLLSVAAGG